MKWVLPRGLRAGGAASAWLVRRFVDTDAGFVFAPAADVAALAERTGALGIGAAGAAFPPEDVKGRTPFEQLAQRYCYSDLVLREMGRIVGSAADPGRLGDTAEGAGLRAIGLGFPLAAAGDDEETVERTAFLFDALYAALAARLRAEPE